MVRLYRRVNRYVPALSMVFFLLGLAALVINIAYVSSPSFADAFNGGVSSHIRVFLAHLTGWIPFSLAEFLFLGSPVILVAVIVLACRKGARSRRYFARALIGILSAGVLLYAMFVFVFGAGYRTTGLDKKLGIERTKVTADELADTARIVVDRLNELSDNIMIFYDDGSVRPYSHDECVRLCLDAYEKVSKDCTFLARLDAPVKEIVLSDYMTYTHISGMYTFFTGEANLNTNYPDFVNVYTTAHEMAHQRGIAREDEANFMAFLVCIASDDPYMQYSGYLNLYEYLSSALSSAGAKEVRKEIAESLDVRVRYDLYCYSVFFDKYRENTAATVSNTVNNTYLVMQGTPGAKSYGLVVDLAVAYYRGER
ncbi:MAG: DUF3810 domain-containing protein [Clostridiales bacterium]|nr:DUF3810 domain-containing protein [Clostridiales bacterium]